MDFDKFYVPINISKQQSNETNQILIIGKDRHIYQIGLLSWIINRTDNKLDNIDIQSM